MVATTDSRHNLRVYPNLAGSMKLTGLDQLWIADITYIRLEMEFVYLAVVLDAFSRRVIGWALDRWLPRISLARFPTSRISRSGSTLQKSSRRSMSAGLIQTRCRSRACCRRQRVCVRQRL